MLTVFVKEIRSFLSSLIAYITIGVFLLAIGLFMWVFKDTNVLDGGYANIDTLFFMGPWVFIFLISAITMRSFSEEKKVGTIETLTTSPVSDMSVIMGKYLAGVVLVLFSLLPTLLYYYTIHQLGYPKGNIDTGAMWGSYLGLLMLGSAFVSIGVFASAITDNQIVSFVISIFLCFFFYIAFEYIGQLDALRNVSHIIQWVGISSHYESISRGVLDTRDAAYFISLITLFLLLSKAVFGSRKW